MVFPSDIYYFVCPLSGTVSPGDEPIVTVLDAATGLPVSDANSVLVQARSMTLIAGSNKVYTFAWRIAANQTRSSYIALVTYTLTGVYHHDEFLDKVQVGDSRITGVVALDATAAKDATVAKDLTVAKAGNLTALDPSQNSTVLAIKAKTDLLPATPLGLEHLCTRLLVTPQAGSLAQMLIDILDAEAGSWILDKTVTPNILTIRRADGSGTLASFQLTDDNSAKSRQRI